MQFHDYSLITEYVAFVIAVVMEVFILVTRPRKTSNFRFLHLGVILSIIEISLRATAIEIAMSKNYLHYINVFYFSIVLSMILYMGILLCMFAYLVRISPLRSSQTKNRIYMALVYSTIYVVAALVAYFTGNLFSVSMAHGIDVDGYIIFTALFSSFFCLLCYLIIAINRDKISRLIKTDLLVFILFEAGLVAYQAVVPGIVYISVTYVLPFLIGYMLFHSNPLDEDTGCQNGFSMESYIHYMIRMRRKFLIVNFSFPQLGKAFDAKQKRELTRVISEYCRRIEKLDKKVKIYRVSKTKFAVICHYNWRYENMTENFIEQIRQITQMILTVSPEVTYAHVVYFKYRPVFRNMEDIEAFSEFLRAKIKGRRESGEIVATDEDYEDFVENKVIRNIIEEIAETGSLDDDRILCYAQPIYSVKDGNFRTAEALMRMKVGNRVVAPYKFIPVAEDTNSIHSLTKIMVNKVCKQIMAMDKKFDFDAITINCSAKELSDLDFHENIMEIVDMHNVPRDKIRLELTESVMFENYEAVRHNMDELNRDGISFYLDDFGSGYSNIDRLTSGDFDIIKFDKTLLYKAMQSDGTDEMVSMMVNFFKKRDMIPLVEGVENEEQSKYCVDRGFEYIQGFKYAKPVPIENLVEYFARLD